VKIIHPGEQWVKKWQLSWYSCFID